MIIIEHNGQQGSIISPLHNSIVLLYSMSIFHHQTTAEKLILTVHFVFKLVLNVYQGKETYNAKSQQSLKEKLLTAEFFFLILISANKLDCENEL